SREGLAAICAGVLTLVVVRFVVFPSYPGVDPTLAGILVAAAAFLAALMARTAQTRIVRLMEAHHIAVLAGDGIGKEVIPAGIEVLSAAAAQGGFKIEFTHFPWGCDFYLRKGRMMDADAVDQLMKFDAIYLGAIGDPRVPDHISA